MGLLQEISDCSVKWSLGLMVLIGLAASKYSGIGTIVALLITAFATNLSALSGTSLTNNENFRKKRLCDILDFFKIWFEVLEVLTASATCARVVSATIDYISNGHLRDWILGIESHSLGEPWPDVIGFSIVIVTTALFMFGLEKSTSFCALILGGSMATFIFFITVGGTHTILELNKWFEDFQSQSIQSILTAAAMCSYGFIDTYPKLSQYKRLKILCIVLLPIIFYSTIILVFTLMTHYRELSGNATPLLKVFEIRDVDLARLVMAIFIIFVICLVLTQVFPLVYSFFILLSSGQWQIFLASLQYKNNMTGAPVLAIFAAGSLVAILAFACPLAYLIKILNTANLLKNILRSIHVIYQRYKPEFNNDTYMINPTGTTQYSQLKTSKTTKTNNLKNLLTCWKKTKTARIANVKNRSRKLVDDNECLLLDDYCDKSVELVLEEDSSDDNDEIKEDAIMASSDSEDSLDTDVDAVVEEYRERIQVATIDNFHNNRRSTPISIITVMIFVIIIILITISIGEVIIFKVFHLIWAPITGLVISSIIILLMPVNSIKSDDELLVRPLTPICAILSLVLNLLLMTMIIESVWPGLLFWLIAGCLLFWRCDCCTCDGLCSQKKLNITENFPQLPDKYVDTILISR